MTFSWFLSVAQGLLLLLAAPALLGWLDWCKAYLTGRRRPLAYLLQPYRDLRKLLRVPPTHSLAVSSIFRLTPGIVFVVYGCLLFILPVFTAPLLQADLVLILYLLGLARFTFSLAGLDSASAFGGLGSSREMFFHFLTEISLFALIAAMSLWSDGSVVGQAQAQPMSLFRFVALLVLVSAFFPVLLLEARRLPVDNPDTHLELTMAGKAVELEFSGRDLALIGWAESSKLFFLLVLWAQLWSALVGNAPGWLLLVRTLGLPAGAVLLALWEWRTPKLRLGQVSSIAQGSLFLSLFAILLRLIPGG